MNNPDDMNQRIAELEALQAQARRWKTGPIIITLAVVISCVYSIYDSTNLLIQEGPRQQVLMERMREGVNTSLLPSVRVQASKTLERMGPMLAEEIKGIEGRSEEIAQAFHREFSVFEQNVSANGNIILDETFGRAIEKREETFRKLYPELTDERLSETLGTFFTEFEKKVVDIGDELFLPHMAAMGGIIEHVETIRDTEEIGGTEDGVDLDLALLVLGIVRNEFADVEDHLLK